MTGTVFYFAWEVALMISIQGLLERIGSFSITIAAILTIPGEELVVIAVLAFIYLCFDKEAGKKLGLSVVTGNIINPMLKNIVLRRRPYFDHPEIKCLKPVDSSFDIYDVAGQGFSFPSNHSTNAVIVYGGIPIFVRKNRVTVSLAIILPLMVGLSRVLVGVHYPTDVLAGWITGAAVLFLIRFLQERVKKSVLYLVIFFLSCTGIFFCRTTDYFTSLGVMGGTFAAFLFEDKYVHFENTKKPLFCILRIVFAIAIYLGLSALLKLVFSYGFPSSGTMSAYLARSLRYLIVTFVALGVYPVVFKIIEKS